MKQPILLNVDRSWFRARMRSMGFSGQDVFAAFVGLNGPKLSNLLMGRRRPQVDELNSMSRALDVPLETMMRCFGVATEEQEVDTSNQSLVASRTVRNQIQINRVKNGWIITESGSGADDEVHIAATPGELAGHVLGWSSAQETEQ